MKKRTIAMVLAAAMMVLAAGCQKEEATRVAPVNSERTVEYSIDNNRQHVTVEGTAEWQALLGECLDRAAEGHLVNISHGAGANYAKERQVYATESRDAAMAWVDARFNEGYDVTMWYDEEEGKYICVASKLAPPTGGDTLYPRHVPLTDYLQGNWTRCTDHEVVFSENAGYVDYDVEGGLKSMTLEQVYDLYDIVPANITNPSGPFTIQFTDTTVVWNTNEPQPYIVSSPYSIISGINSTSPYKRYVYEWSSDTLLMFTRMTLMVIPHIYVRNY